MANPSKDKGTKAEVAALTIVNRYYPLAKRNPPAGSKDVGDIGGVPFTVIEVKDQAIYNIPAWMRETEVERVNADALTGILVVKPKGIGYPQAGHWWAIRPLAEVLRDHKLLQEYRVGTR